VKADITVPMMLAFGSLRRRAFPAVPKKAGVVQSM